MIIHSAYIDKFSSSFLAWVPNISFSHLIALARTASTTLNSHSKIGHPHICYFPILLLLLTFHFILVRKDTCSDFDLLKFVKTSFVP